MSPPPDAPPEATPDRSRQLVLGLAIFAGLSFVGGLLLAVLDPGEVAVRSHEADSFSRSAIGHRGLVRWLRALDVPVVVSRVNTAAKARAGTVLALLEPPSEPPSEDETGRVRRLIEASAADAIVLALPKWTGLPHRDTDGWVARLDRTSDADRDRLLSRLGLDLRSADASAGDWSWHGEPPPGPITLRDPRGVVGAIDPLLTRGETVVVGVVDRDGTPLIIVADPDLLANAGLVGHAPLLAALFEPLLTDPPRALVVDETLHGYLSTASVARQLFEFPLAALTAQAGAMVLLALLAGMRRFGAPWPAERTRGGRRILVENTAALGHYAGHDGDALERYWRATAGAVSRALHAPPGLDRPATLDWLARVAEARGIDDDPVGLSRAASGASAADRLATARRIHVWRRSMLSSAASGPSARNPHRRTR